MSFIPFLQAAQGAAPSASATGSLVTSFLPIALIILIMYLFLIRPQSKRQKETEKMLNALKKGDKIITIGGIHGTISSVKEKTVIVKVDDDAKIEFNRTAISSVELSDAEKAKLAEAEAEKKAKKTNKKNKKEVEAEKVEEKSAETEEK